MSKLKPKYQAYPLDTPSDLARKRYEHKYGRPPIEVVEAGCILLVGPIGAQSQPSGAAAGPNQEVVT